MPKNHSDDAQDLQNSGEHEQSLSVGSVDYNNAIAAPHRAPPRQQPSIARPVAPGTPRTPRTPNRVRFDIEETQCSSNDRADYSSDEPEEWLEEEDYSGGGGRSNTGLRAPLLTDIDAPSVVTALEIDFHDLLETARPKSGMSSAFMNMANSIIGAGIIGTYSNLLGEKSKLPISSCFLLQDNPMPSNKRAW